MPALGDSDAFLDGERILPQHQAVLTLLQDRLSNPNSGVIKWLDLACGRGQIIVNLDSNLSPEARWSIKYSGYDINHEYALETRQTADSLGLRSVHITVGELSDFSKLYPTDERFDFITLTNTVHEVAPNRLAAILVDCILRLAENGTLFVYDMERVRPPELGAVPWSRDEIGVIVRAVLDGIGANSYQPEIGLWKHRTTNAWNVQVQRQHLGVTEEDATHRRDDVVIKVTQEIVGQLNRKLELCRMSLESLTIYGAETSGEQADKVRLLSEFWAISRALEKGQ